MKIRLAAQDITSWQGYHFLDAVGGPQGGLTAQFGFAGAEILKSSCALKHELDQILG